MMPSHGCSEKYSSNACGALQNAGAPKFARPNQLTEQSQIPKSDPVADPWGGGKGGDRALPDGLQNLLSDTFLGFKRQQNVQGLRLCPGPTGGAYSAPYTY